MVQCNYLWPGYRIHNILDESDAEYSFSREAYIRSYKVVISCQYSSWNTLLDELRILRGLAVREIFDKMRLQISRLTIICFPAKALASSFPYLFNRAKLSWLAAVLVKHFCPKFTSLSSLARRTEHVF